jgi:predicted AlkP superfamily phosphohydrolase/phosphomutase
MKLFKYLIIFSLILLILGCSKQEQIEQEELPLELDKVYAEKVYWFIPDGMRAEPDLFNIFRWAEEGKLPNIKRLMDMGSYGFTIPTFPSHTPTNFASLFTGAYPEVHGVADGPMRVEGNPLARPSIGGFSSVAKKVPPIWTILEEQGMDFVLLSVPGSTPPELRNGITIRGRWGGWGADFHSIIYEKKSTEQRKKLAKGSRLFFLGKELTQFIEPTRTQWNINIESFSKPLDLELDIYGSIVYTKIIDTTNDKQTNYDKAIFSKDKENKEALLGEGEWSNWIPVNFKWSKKDIGSFIKINMIKLEDNGFFRIRFVVNNLNKYIVEPARVSDELIQGVGPMVDFVDNFPPQLIYYPEDKKAFLQEAGMSFEWHRQAADFIFKEYDPDFFIHNIYTPNQMLTSRWWLGYIDPSSARYNDVSETEREVLWNQVEWMYKKLDDIIGEAIEQMDEKSLVILSSDHGATPLDKWVRLNNLFAKEGLLKFTINKETGEPIIDWENTKVIYLKMDNIYIDPNGLEGDWIRASSQDYEKLRDKVIIILDELRDDKDNKILSKIVKWEDAPEFLDLPKDRVGDLIVANAPGYGWNEEVTEDLQIFDIPLKTGYKQAILPKEVNAMWTPFIIAGPGVKQGFMIKEPISVVDQFPTIMELLGKNIPKHVQGRVIDEILE